MSCYIEHISKLRKKGRLDRRMHCKLEYVLALGKAVRGTAQTIKLVVALRLPTITVAQQ